MSTGSNNIIIAIQDQVDPNIQAKIIGIGNAAAASSGQLAMLQQQLASVNAATTQLTQGLGTKLPAAQAAATGSTGRLTGAIAQLLGRVVGAEAGVGMLGGAFSRVGVAAGLAGPLIIAALAVGAIVGAILVYNKFEEAARKLVEAQTAQYDAITASHTRYLELKETLVGLTEGPMAKYRQELADINSLQIGGSSAALLKVLDEQQSKWARLVATIEKYGPAILAAEALGTLGSFRIQETFSVQQGEDFIKQADNAKAKAASEGQALKGLQDDLAATGLKLRQIHDIEQQETGRNLANTEVARKSIQDYYKSLLDDLNIYNAERAIKVAGANGELLSEQKAAAEEQLKAFNEEVSRLKESSDRITPNDILALRQKQQSGDQSGREVTNSLAQLPAFRQNIPALEKDQGSLQQSITKEGIAIDTLIKKYQDVTIASGAYSIALKQQIADAEIISEQTKSHPTITSDQLQKLEDAKNAEIALAGQHKATADIYNAVQGPLIEYNDTIAATTRLLKDQAITTEQKSRYDLISARSLQDAIDPLNQYKESLASEISLIGKYGTALTVATDVEQVRLNLLKQGIVLSDEQTAGLTKFLTVLQQLRDVQADVNALQQANAGTVEKLLNNQIALNTAKAKGIITESQFKVATAQTNIQLADQAVAEGKNATLQNQLVAGLGKYLAGYQGLTKGVSDAYGKAFATIADGAANSISRAIVYGENLGDAMKEVARTIASDLISAFIKLGIQWVLNEVLSKTLSTSATAVTIAQAAAVATAWAPAAAFASLASFGANAAPAGAAVSGTLALTEALALVGGKRDGGLITGAGTGTSDSILKFLSHGEFVVNADATAKNRALLESINSGSRAVSVNSGSVGSGGGNNLQVHVIHDGSTGIQVQQIDENTVRVIAKQEARSAVQTHAPGVIAADLANPNSRTSKGMIQNINAPRRR